MQLKQIFGPSYFVRALTENSILNRIYFTDFTGQIITHIIIPIVLVCLLIAGCLIVYFFWRCRKNTINKQQRTNQFSLEEQTALQETNNEPNPEVYGYVKTKKNVSFYPVEPVRFSGTLEHRLSKLSTNQNGQDSQETLYYDSSNVCKAVALQCSRKTV